MPLGASQKLQFYKNLRRFLEHPKLICLYLDTLTKYLHIFKNLHLDRSHGVAPHKPVLLISVFQSYQEKLITDQRIFITPELVSLFKANWNLLVVTNHDCRISYPFYYLKSDNFWKLIPRNGFENINQMGSIMKSFSNLNAAIDHAEINDDQWVYLTGMKVLNREGKIEFVIVASFKPDPLALIKYRDRWQIETMFKAFKSGGFNFEDTHLTNPERIAKLIALVCVAFIWVYLVGISRNNNGHPIEIKKHGRRAYSLFKFSLMFIAHAFLNPLSIKDRMSMARLNLDHLKNTGKSLYPKNTGFITILFSFMMITNHMSEHFLRKYHRIRSQRVNY